MGFPPSCSLVCLLQWILRSPLMLLAHSALGLFPRFLIYWLVGGFPAFPVHCLQGTFSSGGSSSYMRWHQKHVLFHSDNEAVVHRLNSRTSRAPSLMELLCSLLLSATCYSFSFSAQHIPGANNPIADALSHFYCQAFWQLAPEEEPVPTSIPIQLLLELTPSP